MALPLIVVIQDNGVALGTRREARLESGLKSLAASHGVPGLECDGNHVLDVYHTVRRAREICLAGNGPVVIYARTFRMGGHATHDEAEGRALFPEEVFRHWGARDPVACFEEYLKGPEGPLKNAERCLAQWEAEVTAEVEQAAQEALQAAKKVPPDPTGIEHWGYGE